MLFFELPESASQMAACRRMGAPGQFAFDDVSKIADHLSGPSRPLRFAVCNLAQAAKSFKSISLMIPCFFQNIKSDCFAMKKNRLLLT